MTFEDGLERLLGSEKIKQLGPEDKAKILKKVQSSLDQKVFIIYATMDRDVYNNIQSLKERINSGDDFFEIANDFICLRKDLILRDTTNKLNDTLSGLECSGQTLESLFLVYKDGRLIAQHNSEECGMKDGDIMAGMLTAVQDFIKNCLEDDSTDIKSINYGNMTLAVEQGDYAYMAAIFSGENKQIIGRLRTSLNDFEGKYRKQLMNWDGDLTTFVEAQRYLKKVSR